MYLNLELIITNDNHKDTKRKKQRFGRIIFHTEDVDKLYSYFKSSEYISNLITFENEPTNAVWGERYFHIRDQMGINFHLQNLLVKKRKTFKA